MTVDAFKTSLTQSEPPAGLNVLLRALWHEGKGNWEAAHEVAQAANTPAHCRLHAYLHRKEGDHGNARYWYSRAGCPVPATSLAEEWEALVRAFGAA